MKKAKVIERVNPLILKGVAHRGLFTGGVSENSINAFKFAIEKNYAVEYDIHLTKDGELIVIHDHELERLTTDGKGIVEEHTLEELKKLHLKDGQQIPTFEEVLNCIDEKVPSLIELKVRDKNYKALAKKTIEVITPHIRDKKNYVFISFDPRSLWPLKKMGIIRLLLVAKSDEYTFTWFKNTVEGVDLDLNLFDEKRIQRYYKNHFVNAWTIREEAHFNMVKDYCDTVTFDTIDYKLIRDLLEKK